MEDITIRLQRLGATMSKVQLILFICELLIFLLTFPCEVSFLAFMSGLHCEIKEIESLVPVSVIICDLPSCHGQILQISQSWCLRRDDSGGFGAQ